MADSRVDFEDELSKHLVQCAILVKKRVRGPLLVETLHKLTEYMGNNSVGASSSPADKSLSSSTTPNDSIHLSQQEVIVERYAERDNDHEGSLVATTTTRRKAEKEELWQRVFALESLLSRQQHHQQQQPIYRAPPVRYPSQQQQQHTRGRRPSRAGGRRPGRGRGVEARGQRGPPSPPPRGGRRSPRSGRGPGQGQRIPSQRSRPSRPPNQRMQSQQPRPRTASRDASSESTTSTSASSSASSFLGDMALAVAASTMPLPQKPAFRAGAGSNSNIIALGWLDLLRPQMHKGLTSVLPSRWENVLVSIVEGKGLDEGTTMWIQREVDQTTEEPESQKKELQVYCEIPVHEIQSVSRGKTVPGTSFDGDWFLVSVYESEEEFICQCHNNPDAAQNWVATLQSLLDSLPSRPPLP